MWAATVNRGMLAPAQFPSGMEIVRTKSEKERFYVTLRDLTGVSDTRSLCIPGAKIQLVDLNHNSEIGRASCRERV